MAYGNKTISVGKKKKKKKEVDRSLWPMTKSSAQIRGSRVDV